jgi:hypothetical protein
MSRFDARQDFLRYSHFKVAVTEAMDFLYGRVEFALIGGLAVSFYANPPVTVDIDFLVKSSWFSAYKSLVPLFEENGWKSNNLCFPGGKGQISDVFRMIKRHGENKSVVDLLLTNTDEFLVSVVNGSSVHEVQPKLKVPVARIEDILVLKSLAKRDKDVADMEMLGLKHGKTIDYGYVRQTLAALSAPERRY